MLGMQTNGETKRHNVQFNHDRKEINIEEKVNENINLFKNKECQDVLKKKCHYDILGLQRSSNEDDIRKAYKKVRFSILIK